jgi:hypothetical protein
MERNSSEVQRLFEAIAARGRLGLMPDPLAGLLGSSGQDSTGEKLSKLESALAALRRTGEEQLDVVSQNTKALQQNTVVVAQSGSTGESRVKGVVSSVLGNLFGASPLIGGLLKLFGGSKAEEPAPLIRYVPPSPIQATTGLGPDAGRFPQPVDYGQDGQPRIVETRSATYSPQITVQVNAIDTRSFLDHSAAIARAVREAMLHGHSINDVVNEL